jgi:hypothetical protein
MRKRREEKNRGTKAHTILIDLIDAAALAENSIQNQGYVPKNMSDLIRKSLKTLVDNLVWADIIPKRKSLGDAVAFLERYRLLELNQVWKKQQFQILQDLSLAGEKSPIKKDVLADALKQLDKQLNEPEKGQGDVAGLGPNKGGQ